MPEQIQPFYEEQKIITAPWFIWCTVILQALLLGGFIFGVFQGSIESGKAIAFNLFISNFPVLVLLWAAATDVKLITCIDAEGFSFRWHPFRKNFKTLRWTDIASIDNVTYGFAGYGWRFSMKYGEINNVRGNRGMVIIMKNGSRYLLGTKRSEEEINEVMRRFEPEKALRFFR